MKKLIAGMLLIIATNSLADHYAGSLSIQTVRLIGSTVMFGTSPKPAHTCSNYGEFFKFSIDTVEGKFLYTTLLTAKAHNKKISVWYNGSSATGTDHTNGCGGDAVAELYGIAIL